MLLLAGCEGAGNQGAADPAGAAGKPVAEVGVIRIAPQPLTLRTELPGRTAPYAIAEVRPQVGGIIQARLFEEGSQIEAEQQLYQIDDARYRAAFDSAAAALQRSRATHARARMKAERYADLLESKSVSQEDYDDVQVALKEAAASVAVDEAALAAARIALDDTRVVSPIAGRIGRSSVTQGALVTANQPMALATVRQLDPIHVDLTQSSAQVLRLRRALEDGRLQRPGGEQPKVTLILEDGTTYPHAGRLAFSEVNVDEGTGSLTLRATFPNPDGVLLPGMFVRALVEEGLRPDAILAPQQAVQRDRRGNPYVFVLGDDGTIEQRQVETNRALQDQWLIDAGLQPGERVVVDGLQKVKPGDTARAVEADAPSASDAAG
ncbi:efflux RND transporter periplasmic adaptor subunit [Thiohalocapsa marina]|uniref:Efflux RND transporter periplasmic adaptor subunit n=2 Tax=Thiohalocapsa marina TaxID=424902 RepID=A0A5M8FI37_9GAMM|nr:efflux RND transporter periplasmic adaptor subunit [Thiohalocapsa marina]